MSTVKITVLVTHDTGNTDETSYEMLEYNNIPLSITGNWLESFHNHMDGTNDKVIDTSMVSTDIIT